MPSPAPQDVSAERRRTPRLEPLGHPIRCTFDETRTYPDAILRDLAVNSLRFELRGRPHLGLRPHAVSEFEAHIGELGLYLRCRARVARTYSLARNGETITGAAVQLQGLDPAARGAIRGLYPPGTVWPSAIA